MKGTIRNFLKDFFGAVCVFVFPIALLFIAFGFGY
jgi:hypothetical protein